MPLSRRDFLETAALGTLAAHTALAAEPDAKTGMPMRVLGKTNARVSILAFGSGSRFLMYKTEEEGLAALSKALDQGITYVDTAFGYGNGKSETWVGKIMPQRRKSVFLATKVNARNGDEAMRIIEGSLKRLQTDHVDLLHIHSLTDEADLAAIEAKGAVLDRLLKLRDQKVARAIGVTSHTDPAVLKTALERHDFDCTQMALNAARVGQANNVPYDQRSFEKLALPVAQRKNMGVIAMKIFAQEKLNGKAPVDQLIRYSLSLPITTAVIGMPQVSHIEENIRVAKAFHPLDGSQMQKLSDELSTVHKASIDSFFADHIDA